MDDDATITLPVIAFRGRTLTDSMSILVGGADLDFTKSVNVKDRCNSRRTCTHVEGGVYSRRK